MSGVNAVLLTGWTRTRSFVTVPAMKEIAPQIVVDPAVRFGKPVVAGTRVAVADVVGMLAGGMTVEEVVREYDLTADQVRAALRYAARVVADEDVLVTA